jgi:hypothetical protein
LSTPGSGSSIVPNMNYSAASVILSPILTPIYICLAVPPHARRQIFGVPHTARTPRRPSDNTLTMRRKHQQPPGRHGQSVISHQATARGGRTPPRWSDRQPCPTRRSIAFRVRGSNGTSGQQQISNKNGTSPSPLPPPPP